MATLQTSGAISLANIQTVMGGSNPISISEYYRGGAYTPATRTTTVSEGPFYNSSYQWIYNPTFGQNRTTVRWDGTTVYDQLSVGPITTVTVGSVTYYRGALYQSSKSGTNYYYVSRQYPSTTNINTSVPTSGTISISQFYGAAKP
jgi:hypothetical protein